MAEGEEHMRRAIELAERGRHRVMPNPLVGCVLVKDGEVVAEGWHDHIGGLHAEQMAIAEAESKGVATHGTTAYVTLEPCNHFGRTPPCTESLLWAGVGKVVIGALDPNPTVRGDGANTLRESGVEVVTGVLEDECESQMDAFMHWCRERRPLVTLKASTDLSGRIDGDPSEPAVRFSSDLSLELAQKIRADSMAILVGVETVIRDDPSLTVRGPDLGPREGPTRVVLDPNDRVPDDCVLMTDGAAPTLIIQSSEHDSSRDRSHVTRVVIPEQDIPVSRILDMLGDMGVQSLLVEGGAETWRRFLTAGMVDKARICVTATELEGGSVTFDKSLLGDGMKLVSKSDASGDSIEWWNKAPK
jgi:diaminohydroxyphosphoribosylaminopyrimidine deaminase/5-amino-6-(5-phosphoribosylamino)uracil reductase